MDCRSWYYFGCYGDKGHFLWNERGQKEYHSDFRIEFDMALCPTDTRQQGIAELWRLNKYDYTALAFWDYTIDKRPGSNSIIFAPGLTLSADDIVQSYPIKLPFLKGRWSMLDIRRAARIL